MVTPEPKLAAAIGKNLRKYRKAKGWQQNDFCHAAGVSQQSMSNYESGIAIPRLVTLIRMADLLSVTINDLIEGR